jgi:hypothetical protein
MDFREGTSSDLGCWCGFGQAVELRAASPSAVKRVGSTAQRLKEKPYEKRVCRVECYPSCLNPEEAYVGLSVEEYVDLVHPGGVGSANRGRRLGLWNTTLSLESGSLPIRLLTKIDCPGFWRWHMKRNIGSDLLPNHLQQAVKKVIRWLMRFLDDGSQNRELGLVLLELAISGLAARTPVDFLDNLDLDGFYFGDTNWGSHDDRPWFPGCCCSHCERLFTQEIGLRIPTGWISVHRISESL